jgi:hypothetical protein
MEDKATETAEGYTGFLTTNDPIGTMTYYLLFGAWYFLCYNISGLSGTPDKVGVRRACMQGIHNELLYAFDYEYKNPVF